MKLDAFFLNTTFAVQGEPMNMAQGDNQNASGVRRSQDWTEAERDDSTTEVKQREAAQDATQSQYQNITQQYQPSVRGTLY